VSLSMANDEEGFDFGDEVQSQLDMDTRFRFCAACLCNCLYLPILAKYWKLEHCG